MRKVIILIKKMFKKRNKSEIDITDFVNENNTITEDKSSDIEYPAPESQSSDNIMTIIHMMQWLYLFLQEN